MTRHVSPAAHMPKFRLTPKPKTLTTNNTAELRLYSPAPAKAKIRHRWTEAERAKETHWHRRHGATGEYVYPYHAGNFDRQLGVKRREPKPHDEEREAKLDAKLGGP